jgi:glutamate-1-semialdehyde 2,1-aminomutase
MEHFAPWAASGPAEAGPHEKTLDGPHEKTLHADVVGAGFSRPYIFHGGTYNGTPMALAAGVALLNLLEEPGVFEGLVAKAERMRIALRDLFARRCLAAQVIGRGAAFDFYFTSDPIRSSREIAASDLARREALDYRLFELGIYNSPLHRFHVSLAHTDDDLDRTIEAVRDAL